MLAANVSDLELGPASLLRSKAVEKPLNGP